MKQIESVIGYILKLPSHFARANKKHIFIIVHHHLLHFTKPSASQLCLSLQGLSSDLRLSESLVLLQFSFFICLKYTLQFSRSAQPETCPIHSSGLIVCPEGKAQHSQAFFGLAGLTPGLTSLKLQFKITGFLTDYHLSLLSRALCFGFRFYDSSFAQNDPYACKKETWNITCHWPDYVQQVQHKLLWWKESKFGECRKLPDIAH